jgi:hypothetical protein
MRLARSLAAGLIAIAALAGCSSAIDGFAYDEPASSDVVTISSAGVGPITAATAYSPETLQGALPGSDVSPVTMATEGDMREALAVFSNGMQVLQVLGDSSSGIEQIHGVTQRLAGPNGEHIGMTLAEAQPDVAACRVGSGNWYGMPICPARGAPNVILVFALPGDRAETTLPAGADLGSAVLQRIVWTPPA